MKTIIKKAVKIFALPVILGILSIIFHFEINQTLFTWLIEKLLIISTFVTLFVAFPLYFISCKDKDLSIRENFKKVKPRLYSFWKSTLFILALFLGYFLFFFILFSFLPWSENYSTKSDLIFSYSLRLLFPYLITIFFGSKYIFTPIISLFEEKSFFESLWATKNRITIENRFHLFFTFILLSIFYFLLFGIIEFLISKLLISSLVFSVISAYLINFLILIIFSYLIFQNYEKFGKKNKEEKRSNVPVFKKIPVVLGFLVGIPILLVVLFLVFAVSFMDYDPEFDDSSLQVELVNPKKEGNLYHLLKEEGFVGYNEEEKGCAYLEVDDPERLDVDSYAQFVKDNPQKAKNISEKNSKALDCFSKAASKTHYNSPFLFGAKMSNTDNNLKTGVMSKFSRINAFEIARLAEEGKDKEALDRLLVGIKLANLIADQESGPMLVDFLIAVNVKNIHIHGFENINLSNLDDQYLRESLQKINNLEIPKDALDRAFKLEYKFTNDLVDNPEEIVKLMEEMEGSPTSYYEEILSTPSYFYKPNETKKNFFMIYKKIINNSSLEELPFSGEIFLSFDSKSTTSNLEYELPFVIRIAHQLPKPTGEYLLKTISGNQIGMLLNESFLITWNPSRQYEQLQVVKTYHRLQETALAIELYSREYGEFPKKIEDLTPQYLEKVPEDPFTKGGNLKYSKEKKQVYSSETENYGYEPIIINLD